MIVLNVRTCQYMNGVRGAHLDELANEFVSVCILVCVRTARINDFLKSYERMIKLQWHYHHGMTPLIRYIYISILSCVSHLIFGFRFILTNKFILNWGIQWLRFSSSSSNWVLAINDHKSRQVNFIWQV